MMTEKVEETSPIQDIMDTIAGRSEKGASWPVMFFLLAALVIGVSVVGLKVAFTKRKAAKLARELRTLKEEKICAAEDARIKENEEKAKAAHVRLRELHKKEVALAHELLDNKVAHSSYVKELESVTSWDDIMIVGGRDRG